MTRQLPIAAGSGSVGSDPNSRSRDGPEAPDRGAATVWAAGGMAVLLFLSVGVVWIGVAANTRHRAGSAADLAALAAAGRAVSDERSACDRARWVVEKMRVELKSCRLDGWDALIEVTAMPSGVLGSFGPAEARARAGPGEMVTHGRRTVVPGR